MTDSIVPVHPTRRGGPWTYRGQVTGSARNSFTIHPAVVDFKGRTFLFYHNAALSINGEGGALGRRAVCVDELFFNEDASVAHGVPSAIMYGMVPLRTLGTQLPIRWRARLIPMSAMLR